MGMHMAHAYLWGLFMLSRTSNLINIHISFREIHRGRCSIYPQTTQLELHWLLYPMFWMPPSTFCDVVHHLYGFYLLQHHQQSMFFWPTAFVQFQMWQNIFAVAWEENGKNCPVWPPFRLVPPRFWLGWVHTHYPEFVKRHTRCSSRALFLSRTFANRDSPFPPPPAVSSTLIIRPSSVDWWSFKPCWSAFRCENSKKAQPFDFAFFPGPVCPLDLGVRRRIVGGGSRVRALVLLRKWKVDIGLPQTAKCALMASSVVVYFRLPTEMSA